MNGSYTLSTDICVARYYMMRHGTYRVLLPDKNVLSEYESLQRVACHVLVSYKTGLLFALFSAEVDR